MINNWTVSETLLTPSGKVISSGDIIRINGEVGKRFMFIKHVINNDNNAEWIDCSEIWKGAPGMFRSFRPHAIRTIGGKKGKAKPRPKASGDADLIRSWAKSKGLKVSERGRIAATSRDQYYAENGRAAV